MARRVLPIGELRIVEVRFRRQPTKFVQETRLTHTEKGDRDEAVALDFELGGAFGGPPEGYLPDAEWLPILEEIHRIMLP